MSLLEPCCQLQAVHSLHLIVQNHGVNLLFLGLKYVKCVVAIAGGYNLVAVLAEQGSVEFPDPSVIVHAHHSKRFHRGGLPFLTSPKRGLGRGVVRLVGTFSATIAHCWRSSFSECSVRAPSKYQP